jgi:UDP-3-O-[3-hydroxymyristoyl] glucosamine N-acyltransferase
MPNNPEAPEIVYDRSNTPEEFRSPEHVFFHEPTLRSGESLGQWAIPKQISIGEEIYNLQENGTAIHQATEQATDVVIGPHSIIKKGSRIYGRVILSAANTIGESAIIEDQVTTGFGVEVGLKTQISSRVDIGEGVTLGRHSKVLRETNIGDYVVVGNSVIVGAKVILKRNVDVGDNATIAGKAVVGLRSIIMPGASVEFGKKIKPQSIVINRAHHKHVVKTRGRQ